jgi:hypothetical protein
MHKLTILLIILQENKMKAYLLKKVNTDVGATLVEMLVVSALMGIMMLAMLSMQDNQLKSNNYLEFQLKRTQLQTELIGQVFTNANNCACLFAGSAVIPAMPGAPGATLSVLPTQIGRYNFVTPGVCGTATIPQPLVDNVGIDGVRTSSVQLTNIMNINGAYSGDVVIDLQSTKPVLGPTNLPMRIHVDVVTSPAGGGNVNFLSCAISNGASGKQGFCTPNVNWDNTNSMTCPAVANYSSQKITGVGHTNAYTATPTPAYRSSSCCYIPNGPGSNGWCSDYTEAWNNSNFGCSSTANYDAFEVRGVIGGAYDRYSCCYIPKTLPVNARTINSPAFSADGYWSGCGGPYPAYDIIELNVVTGGLGRTGSCTWVPK